MVKMSLKTMLDEADDMVGIQNGRACENTYDEGTRPEDFRLLGRPTNTLYRYLSPCNERVVYHAHGTFEQRLRVWVWSFSMFRSNHQS